MAACDRGERLRIETDRGLFSARGIINATGTWERPHIPELPGSDRFRGRRLHTKDYRTAEAFRGRHVVIVGGGISAIQLLDEISRVTTTTWVTRRPPEFREGPFDEAAGRAAVAIVEDRVRRGEPPGSVASVTGIPITPATGMVTTITFNDLGDGRTEVITHQTHVPELNRSPAARVGFATSLDRFERHVARLVEARS